MDETMATTSESEQQQRVVLDLFRKSIETVKMNEAHELWKCTIDWCLLNNYPRTERILQVSSSSHNLKHKLGFNGGKSKHIHLKLKKLTGRLTSDAQSDRLDCPQQISQLVLAQLGRHRQSAPSLQRVTHLHFLSFLC